MERQPAVRSSIGDSPTGSPSEPSAQDPAFEMFDSTADLIQKTRSGDLAAREALAARYLPLLHRWAHGRLPGNARGLFETSDLVHVTLMRALDHLDTFEPRREGAFLAYLRSALMNLLRNEIRRSSQDAKGTLPDDLPADRSSLFEEMLGREMIAAYESGLASLSAVAQEAVMLRLEFGYSYGEIADALGSPSADAARMVVARGLARLAGAMRSHR
jgi:RNA polymerase sigma factor (sigma-70 family)